MDLNQVARWDPIHAHIYYDDFLAISRRTGRSVLELRRQCLEHQREMIDNEPPKIAAEYTGVRRYIEELLSRLPKR